MTIRQWKRIQELGGMFGIEYISTKGRTFDCIGEAWLQESRRGRLSWAWPFHKYFSEGKYSLFPKISRVINIGEVGLHSNKELQKQMHYNENTIQKYGKDITEYDNNITYDYRKFIEHGIE